MDEKKLSDWKKGHEETYFRFKQYLEAQLQKPYHETILELDDNEDVDSLQQAMTSLASVTSQGNLDIEQLYAKAVEQNDEAACCLCCYLVFEDGAEQLAKAFTEKANESCTKAITDALGDYIRFRKQNQQQETAEVTSNELNILTLRRWHYDHPEEHAEFLSLFQKAYEGDTTFIQNNFFFLIESLNFTGVKGMMAVAASLFPDGDLLVAEVSPSLLPPVRYRGRVFVRIGPKRDIASEAEERILTERRMAYMATFDATPCLGATLDDLNLEYIKNEYLPSVIIPEVLADDKRDIKEQLASVRLYDRIHGCPTYAALILFGKIRGIICQGLTSSLYALQARPLVERC